MTINAQQFIDQVATPVLQGLAAVGVPYSATALNLCMGTIAQESLLGTYLVQEGGPALGIGQIEPASLATVIAALTPAQAAYLAALATPATPEHNVVANLPYAFAVVRLFYWQSPLALPPNTVSGLFDTANTCAYKPVYNTPAGAATLAQWRQNWLLTGITLPA